MITIVNNENKIILIALELESLLVNNFTTPAKNTIAQITITNKAKFNKCSILSI